MKPTNSKWQQFWQMFFETNPPKKCWYFRCVENAELAVDWGKRQLTINGEKIERASDEEAVWIRHTIRQHMNEGRTKKIDL